MAGLTGYGETSYADTDDALFINPRFTFSFTQQEHDLQWRGYGAEAFNSSRTALAPFYTLYGKSPNIQGIGDHDADDWVARCSVDWTDLADFDELLYVLGQCKIETLTFDFPIRIPDVNTVAYVLENLHCPGLHTLKIVASQEAVPLEYIARFLVSEGAVGLRSFSYAGSQVFSRGQLTGLTSAIFHNTTLEQFWLYSTTSSNRGSDMARAGVPARPLVLRNRELSDRAELAAVRALVIAKIIYNAKPRRQRSFLNLNQLKSGPRKWFHIRNKSDIDGGDDRKSRSRSRDRDRDRSRSRTRSAAPSEASSPATPTTPREDELVKDRSKDLCNWSTLIKLPNHVIARIVAEAACDDDGNHPLTSRQIEKLIQHSRDRYEMRRVARALRDAPMPGWPDERAAEDGWEAKMRYWLYRGGMWWESGV